LTATFSPGCAEVRPAREDRLPVMVPRSDKRLCLTHPERTRELRKHLVDALRTLRMAKHPARSASSTRPEPDGLVARVARTACSLCRGSCCRGGGDHGYMDERTMARVRRARPELDAREVLRLYVGLVPGLSYEDSCLFHGEQGCTLPRSIRSDICNSYFCRGLEDYIQSNDPTEPVLIIAGEGDGIRTSPVL
jgi:hypothetical protein